MARFKARVLAVLAAIPEGRVTTYGTIARHLHVTARQVAFILATLTAEESERLPWFRVVAANGVVSGGDGDDLLIGSQGNDLIIGSRGNDVAFMRAGDDTFVWNPGDPAGRQQAWIPLRWRAPLPPISAAPR
jgi:alkylated DNA nucleotide flippase Atl1